VIFLNYHVRAESARALAIEQSFTRTHQKVRCARTRGRDRRSGKLVAL